MSKSKSKGPLKMEFLEINGQRWINSVELEERIKDEIDHQPEFQDVGYVNGLKKALKFIDDVRNRI